MQKSRTLSYDPGDRSDSKFYSYGASLNTTSSLYDEVKSDPQGKYYDGLSKANATPAHSNDGGSEFIDSTTRSKRYFNSVTHYKYQCFNYAYLLLKRDYRVSYLHSYSPYRRATTPSGASSVGAVTSLYTWADVSDCQRRAWWSMQPRWESEVSMLNFIYELKDFGRLMKSIMNFDFAKTMGKLREARRIIQEMAKQRNAIASIGNTSSNASKVLAEAYLFNQFALQPLFSDIKSILGNIEQTANAAQEEFYTRGDFYQKSHYAEKLVDVFTGSWGSYNNDYIFTGTHNETVFNATLEYSYDYEMRHGWSKYQRFWGLELNAKVIWDALPFSFLLDYFCKVGNAIRNMTLDPNVTTHVFQYCESLLTYRHAGIGFNTSNVNFEVFFSPVNKKYNKALKGYVPICGYIGEYYRRRVTVPNKGAALPRFTSASDMQKWNMVALVRGFMK